MLHPTVSFGLSVTVVLKICGNFYSGVGYLDGTLRNIGSWRLIEERITSLSVVSRLEARARLLFQSKDRFGCEGRGECLPRHASSKLKELRALIDRIDGCLTEWDALNRCFEAISVAIECLLAVFLGGALLAAQVSGLGIVGKHFLLSCEEFYWWFRYEEWWQWFDCKKIIEIKFNSRWPNFRR